MTMDKLGRVFVREWTVGNMPRRPRLSVSTEVRELMAASAKTGDELGHGVAHRMGGGVSAANLRNQNKHANRAQRGVEEVLVAVHNRGHQVRARLTDIFNAGNTSSRPDSFIVDWWVDGRRQTPWEFSNSAEAADTLIPRDIKNQLHTLLGYQIPDTLAGLAAMGLPGPATEQPEQAANQSSGLDQNLPDSYQHTDWTPSCTDRSGTNSCFWDYWEDGDDGIYHHTMAIGADRALDTAFEWRFGSVPRRDNFEIWVRIPPQDEVKNPPYATTVTYYVKDSRDIEWSFTVDQRAVSRSGGGWVVAAGGWTLQGTVVIKVYDNRGNAPTYFGLPHNQKHLARFAADGIRLYSPG